MTRAALCLLVAAGALFVGLFTAKLCAGNAARGEHLHRLHLANEMQAAYNESLAAEVDAHVPGREPGAETPNGDERRLDEGGPQLPGVSE